MWDKIDPTRQSLWYIRIMIHKWFSFNYNFPSYYIPYKINYIKHTESINYYSTGKSVAIAAHIFWLYTFYNI